MDLYSTVCITGRGPIAWGSAATEGSLGFVQKWGLALNLNTKKMMIDHWIGITIFLANSESAVDSSIMRI